MRKKLGLILSIPAAMYLQAQQSTPYWDFTELRNSSAIYGNHLDNGTARYMGMGGAMGAIGGDISAMTVNPAGIGVYITGDVQATLGVDNIKNTSNLEGPTATSKSSPTDITQAGAVAALQLGDSNWKFVNFGMNFQYQRLDNQVLTPANHTFAQSITGEDAQGNQATGTMLFDGHRYQTFGHVSKVSLAAGANYNNRLYFGLGLNFHSADYSQSDEYQSVLEFPGQTTNDLYIKQFSPYSESGNGFSASLGVIGKVNEQVRLGLALETPVWWNIDRSYTLYGTDQNGDFGASIEPENRHFRSPMKATFSAAVIPNKNFALDVDYIVSFSKPEFTTHTDINDDLNSYFDQYSKTQSEVRVGAEYRIQGFRLRAGYSYADNPFGSQTMPTANNNANAQTLNDLFIGKRNTASAGIGYDFGGIYVDASYQNVRFNYDNAFANGDYASQDGIFTNDVPIVSKVKNEQNNLYFTIGYRF